VLLAEKLPEFSGLSECENRSNIFFFGFLFCWDWDRKGGRDAQAATWGVRHAHWAVPEIDRVGGKFANHQNRFNCKFCLCVKFEDLTWNVELIHHSLKLALLCESRTTTTTTTS
jgi:hypothetical protein